LSANTANCHPDLSSPEAAALLAADLLNEHDDDKEHF
jgi:hypothetical protein